LLGAAGALGLFLYSQALSILANLATLPTAAQYAGYAGLGILAAAVLFSMARLALLYARLQRNRQLRLRGLEELQSRTRLRWLAHAKTAEAKARLEDYLRSYPINTEKERRSLAKVGVTAEAAAELAKVRDELLDPARYASAGEWFARFQHAFQGKLDAVADGRVSYWSNRAMIVTAVSPNGMVDSLSTSYFGFSMIADLCRVYHLKAGRTGTAVLLARVFFNAYLSGQINDVEKLVEEQYDHVFQQGLHVVGAGVGSNVAGKFLGKVGAKATTGYLNRVLLSRLGKYACRLLRPVTRE
jgi:putative membrane protein